MVWIDAIDFTSNVIDGIPDGRISTFAFHLITNRPQQQGRVVFVFADGGQRSVQLLQNRGLILVVKSVSLMPQPDSCTDGEPVRVCVVE